MRTTAIALTSLVACAVVAGPARAQLRGDCADATRADVRTFCENVADAATILQPRVGLAASGGNPVAGTASTLGIRIGSMPRISIGLRVTAATVDLPPVERLTSDNDVDFPVGSIDADVSVGLFSGINLLPTVGGFASVDLLGSIGTVPLPTGEGFEDASPLTWSAGARVGILRESFTAPGVSVSAMYRSVGDFTFGSESLSDRDAYIRMRDYGVWSVRGTVGKRMFGLGLTAGIGYDRYSAHVDGEVRDPEVLAPTNTLVIEESDMTQDRVSAFGNVSFTLLILNLAAEVGWQQGASPIDGASDLLEDGAIFGGLSFRIAI